MIKHLVIFIILLFSTSSFAGTTWDSSAKGASITLSNGNMTATTSGTSFCSVRATKSFTSGKWYFEIKLNKIAGEYQTMCGVSTTSQSVECGGATFIGTSAYGWAFGALGPSKFNNNVYSTYGPSATNNDIIMVAVDSDAHKIWVGKNGTWTGTPSTGANPMFSNLSGTLFPSISLYANTSSATIRVTNTDCSYTPPTGFDYVDPLPYYISGTIKEKETDASGFAAPYIIYPRAAFTQATEFFTGTAASDGTYSETVPNGTNEYNVIAIHPTGIYAPIVLGEQVLGVH